MAWQLPRLPSSAAPRPTPGLGPGAAGDAGRLDVVPLSQPPTRDALRVHARARSLHQRQAVQPHHAASRHPAPDAAASNGAARPTGRRQQDAHAERRRRGCGHVAAALQLATTARGVRLFRGRALPLSAVRGAANAAGAGEPRALPCAGLRRGTGVRGLSGGRQGGREGLSEGSGRAVGWSVGWSVGRWIGQARV